MKEESSSDRDPSLNLKYCKSAPPENKANNDHSSYCYNFVFRHLKSLFENYETT